MKKSEKIALFLCEIVKRFIDAWQCMHCGHNDCYWCCCFNDKCAFLSSILSLYSTFCKAKNKRGRNTYIWMTQLLTQRTYISLSYTWKRDGALFNRLFVDKYPIIIYNLVLKLLIQCWRPRTGNGRCVRSARAYKCEIEKHWLMKIQNFANFH